jgi:hypothetical protein
MHCCRGRRCRGALARGFDLPEIEDRYLVGVDRYAVGELARRRQAGEIADPFAVLAGRQRIFIEAGRRSIREVEDWHGRPPIPTQSTGIGAIAAEGNLRMAYVIVLARRAGTTMARQR